MAFRPTKTRSPVAGGIRPRTTRLSAVARNRHPAAVAAGWNSASPIARTAFLMGDRRNPDRLVKLDVVDRTRKAPEPMFPSPMSPPTHGSASSGHLNTRRGQETYLAKKINIRPWSVFNHEKSRGKMCQFSLPVYCLPGGGFNFLRRQPTCSMFLGGDGGDRSPGVDRFKSNAGRLTAERDLEPGEIAARLDRVYSPRE